MPLDDYSSLIAPVATVGVIGAMSRATRGIGAGPARRRRVTAKKKKTYRPKPKIKKRIIKASPKKRKSRRKAR